MKILRQIFLILLFYLLGEFISLAIGWIIPNFYFPGAILGMMLLLPFLLYKKLNIDEVGGFLSTNMSFFFIPAAVSVLEYINLLQSTFLIILVIIILSTLISFFAIIGVLTLLKKWEDKRGVAHE